MDILGNMLKAAGIDPAKIMQQYAEAQATADRVLRHFDARLSEITERLKRVETLLEQASEIPPDDAELAGAEGDAAPLAITYAGQSENPPSDRLPGAVT